MSWLGKQLANGAQKCRRLDSDRWQLALTNGHEVAVSARRDEDFLLLDAATGIFPARGKLIPLAGLFRHAAPPVKLAWRNGSPDLRLRAEIPLPEESVAGEGRIRSAIEAMRTTSHCVQNWFSREAAAEETACPEPKGEGQAASGSLIELVKETGWQFHERPAGALLVDLDTGSRFLQAEVDGTDAGSRFWVTLYRSDLSSESARRALCLFLLEANAALRFVRGFIRPEDGGLSAGFEVSMNGAASAAEAGHALAALSVAARHCARELEALKEDALASTYESARSGFIDNTKKELESCLQQKLLKASA